MILAIIRMEVLPEKYMERSQKVASLIGSIRMEKGCKRCGEIVDPAILENRQLMRTGQGINLPRARMR